MSVAARPVVPVLLVMVMVTPGAILSTAVLDGLGDVVVARDVLEDAAEELDGGLLVGVERVRQLEVDTRAGLEVTHRWLSPLQPFASHDTR